MWDNKNKGGRGEEKARTHIGKWRQEAIIRERTILTYETFYTNLIVTIKQKSRAEAKTTGEKKNGNWGKKKKTHI